MKDHLSQNSKPPPVESLMNCIAAMAGAFWQCFIWWFTPYRKQDVKFFKDRAKLLPHLRYLEGNLETARQQGQPDAVIQELRRVVELVKVGMDWKQPDLGVRFKYWAYRLYLTLFAAATLFLLTR